MQEIKKHISNADVPRPSNDELVQMCLEIMSAIEKCGASPELTTAVIKASDLYYALTKAKPTSAPQSAQDDFCDGHCTWRDHHPECVRADENTAPDWSASAVDRINVLEQRIVELERAASEQEKDAARYRYWRELALSDSPYTPEAMCDAETPEQMDAAIDAERACQPCFHTNTITQRTGDGTPVEFCRDCGTNVA